MKLLTDRSQKLHATQRLVGAKARPALSLVGYPHEVANAMAFVFGETLICDDAESAKAVTFARDIGVRSVTLQGDVYDPSGTLSGGAAPHSNEALIRVQELLETDNRLREASERLGHLEREEARTRSIREKWQSVTRELDLKEHEMRLLEEQVGGSNATKVRSASQYHEPLLIVIILQVISDMDTLKTTIQELNTAINEAKEKQKSAHVEIKKLEQDMAEFKNNKEGKIDELKVCLCTSYDRALLMP